MYQGIQTVAPYLSEPIISCAVLAGNGSVPIIATDGADLDGWEDGSYWIPPGSSDVGRNRLVRPRRGRSGRKRSSTAPQLYTACIAYSGGLVMIHAFHASVARHPGEVVQRLRRRFGDDVVPLADIRVGFHPSSPLVIALVPQPFAAIIRSVERNCSTVDISSFVVDVEQRLEM